MTENQTGRDGPAQISPSDFLPGRGEITYDAEHSRAAREFLDPMMEMEEAFGERVRFGQEAAADAGQERLKALESMKKRFHEDLHRRMEIFFAGQHA